MSDPPIKAIGTYKLAGARVTVKGHPKIQGITTNSDGSYSLTIPPAVFSTADHVTLIFSHPDQSPEEKMFKKIAGTTTDGNGEVLVGARIWYKADSSNTVTSDYNGEWALLIPYPSNEGDAVMVALSGYGTMELSLEEFFLNEVTEDSNDKNNQSKDSNGNNNQSNKYTRWLERKKRQRNRELRRVERRKKKAKNWRRRYDRWQRIKSVIPFVK